MGSVSRPDDLMHEGEEALDAGDHERALAIFESVLRDDPEHWGAALDRAEALHLLWRTPEALEAVLALRPPDDEEDDPDRADLEARIREAAGEFDRAEQFPFPPRTAPDDFRAILDEVLESLPDPLRSAVKEVPVLVDPKPTPAMAEHATHITPEILGLFVGTPVGEKLRGPSGYGDVVLLFQRNLERAGATLDEVAKEIRVTLLHEYGHYLGFDEEGIEELGLA
jgi:predicted Zn-dependent protease with MMP-like domain